MKRSVLQTLTGGVVDGLQRWFDQRWFCRRRADYYAYLSSMLQGLRGHGTLIDIFVRDAHRYGPGTVRGRLSAMWLNAYPVAGGDLATTWEKTFPQIELDVVHIAQRSGNQALVQSLDDLSQALRLMQSARRIMFSAIGSAGTASLLAVGMVCAVPAFTVPQLRQVFSLVPPEYYGPLTRKLFYLADLVQLYWPTLLVLTVVCLGWMVWSLPNLTGRARRWLDDHWLWRFYRSVTALRFLAVLMIVLVRHDATSVQLRTALAMQKDTGPPWLRWHIDAMLERLDAGLVGADTFDTGLIDQQSYWYLSDMNLAHGLTDALRLLRQRLAEAVLTDVARQATLTRWVLLLLCVAALLALGLWHYAVIDELRRSLMMFYAS